MNLTLPLLQQTLRLIFELLLELLLRHAEYINRLLLRDKLPIDPELLIGNFLSF